MKTVTSSQRVRLLSSLSVARNVNLLSHASEFAFKDATVGFIEDSRVRRKVKKKSVHRKQKSESSIHAALNILTFHCMIVSLHV